jgi:RHS repeat-associated protein
MVTFSISIFASFLMRAAYSYNIPMISTPWLQTSSKTRALLINIVLTFLFVFFVYGICNPVNAQVNGVVIFSNLTPDTDGVVGIAGAVMASPASDLSAIQTLELREGDKVWASADYPFRMSNDGENPVNVPQGFHLYANLSEGSHTLYLRAYTFRDAHGDSPNFIFTPLKQVDGALFLAQSGIPQVMTAGQTYRISVKVRNTGTTTWLPTGDNPFFLGAQNPQDSFQWGIQRVPLDDTVAPGANHTFNFDIVAPVNPGSYQMQWRMVHEFVNWFGDFTDNVSISVGGKSVPQLQFSSPQSGDVFSTTSNSANVVIGAQATTTDNTKIAKLDLFDNGIFIATSLSSSPSVIQVNQAFKIGAHKLELTATDVNGGQNTLSRTFNVIYAGTTTTPPTDPPITPPTLPPTVQFQSPSPNYLTNYVSVVLPISQTIVGSAVPAQGVSISKIDLYDNGSFLTSVNGSSFSASRSFQEGLHRLELVATDSAKNTGRASAVLNVVAIKPAYVELQLPNSNATIGVTSGQSADIRIVGVANRSTNELIDSFELWIDGKYVDAVKAGIFDKIIPMSIGSHTIQLKAYYGQSAVRTVNVVGLPSAPVFTQPINNSSFSNQAGATVQISGSISPTSGTSVQFFELWEGSQLLATTQDVTIAHSRVFANGLHTLELRFTNNLNQVSRAFTKFNVDSLGGPSIVFSSPSEGSSYTITSGTSISVPFIANAVAGVGGSITRMDVLDKNASIYGVDNSSVINSSVPLAAGVHSLKIRVKDNAGRVTTGMEFPISVSSVTGQQSISITSIHQGDVFFCGRPGNSDGCTASIPITGVGFFITNAGLSLDGGPADGVTIRRRPNTDIYDLSGSIVVPLGVHKLKFNSGDASSGTLIFTVAPMLTGANSTFISQVVPPTMVAGRSYPITITMQSSGTSDIFTSLLAAVNPYGSRQWTSTGTLPLKTGNGMVGTKNVYFGEVIAPKLPGRYNMQWQLVQTTQSMDYFGAKTDNVWVDVVAGAGPISQLKVTPLVSRAVGTTLTSVTFAGSGTENGRVIKKLQVLRDDGKGWLPVSGGAITGNAPTLSISGSDAVTVGGHKYILVSTDDLGAETYSDPVVIYVNPDITQSNFIGELTGAVADQNGVPRLTGWSCLPSDVNVFPRFDILLDAPTVGMGGVYLTSMTASYTGGATQAKVEAVCPMPGVYPNNSRFLSLDLTPYIGKYSGRAIFATVGNYTLPCSTSSCTVPDSLRIGLTTPPTASRYREPATVFIRTQLSGGAGPYDEVAIGIDGEWASASPDGAFEAYSIVKQGLKARPAPYVIQARVRQGNLTILSQESTVIVDSSNGVSISIDSPSNNTTLSSGSGVALSSSFVDAANIIASVKYFANGQLIAAGNKVGKNWQASWNGISQGIYSLVAVAYDSSQLQIARSIEVNVIADASYAASSAAPLPVTIVPPMLANDNAGSLPGELGVSNNGSATYGISLVVPPGTAGLAPDFSLNYTGDGPNGLYGLGWSLGGMHMMRRCGKTIAQDGINGRISFDNGDRLCLDGKRLILVNLPSTDDNYWSTAAEYRTEIDDFSRVTMHSDTGHVSFVVETKGGLSMRFGSTDDSFVKAVVNPVHSGINSVQPDPLKKTKALAWALDQITDRSGNYIRYSYSQDQSTGEFVPTYVRYGAAGHPSHAAILFTADGTRKDFWTRYTDEARNDLRSRIKKITTVIGGDLDGVKVASGQVVRDYILEYEQSPTSGRSLLTSIQVSANEPQTGISTKLPATVFKWGKPAQGKNAGFESMGYWSNAPVMTTHDQNFAVNHDDYFSFADFENHGVVDVLEKRIASPTQPYSAESENFVHANPIAPGTLADHYNYYHNNGLGFTKYPYRLNTNEKFAVLGVADFNGDGAPDILVWNGSLTKVCLSPLVNGIVAGASSDIVFSCASPPNFATFGSNDVFGIPYLIDVDGDGRSAMYSRIENGAAKLGIQNQLLQDAQPPYSVLGYEYQMYGMTVTPEQSYLSFDQMIDWTGNGKPSDVRWTIPHLIPGATDSDGTPGQAPTWVNLTPKIVVTNFRRPGLPVQSSMQDYVYATEYPLPDTKPGVGYPPYRFDTPQPGASISADFNGSGYGGTVFGFLELKHDAQTSISFASRAELNFCLSTGRSLDCSIRKKYSGTNYQTVRAVGNFVGDGHPSLLVETTTNLPGHEPVPAGGVQICSIISDDTTGDQNDAGMNCSPWEGLTIPSPNSLTQATDQIFFMDLMGTGRTQVVLYHAGKMDGNHVWQPDDRWEVLAPRDLAESGQALDKIWAVTNGFGATSYVEYVDGLPSGVISSSHSSVLSYPQHPSMAASKIVRRLHTPTGGSDESILSYRYKDSGLDVHGRGGLGFERVEITDEGTGIVTESTFAQAWPLTGMVSQLTVTANQGGRSFVLSDLKNQLKWKSIGQQNGTATQFPYVANSSKNSVDLDGSDLGTVVVAGDGVPDVTYDEWGNLLAISTTVTGSLLSPGTSYSEVTNNIYFAADVNHWLVGLMKTTSNIRSGSTSGAALTRTKMFTYESGFTGKVNTITAEPGDAQLKSVLTITRSKLGLEEGKTLSWGTNQLRWDGTSYDPLGRFPISYSRNNNSIEVREFDSGTGAMISRKDFNGQLTTWNVDGFGRTTREIRPDGNESRHYYKRCAGNCPGSAVVASILDELHGPVRIAVPRVFYHDALGHLIQGASWAFDGTSIEKNYLYDSRGLLREEKWPNFQGQQAYTKRKLEYDNLGRLTSVASSDEAGMNIFATFEYHGFKTVSTNANLQQRIEFHNAAGQLEAVVDALGHTTQFSYDPFGQVIRTIDPNGNSVEAKYDVLGHRIELNDPDLGRITYTVDAIGQVLEKITPEQRKKGQATTYIYDSLGRLTRRSEDSLVSSWYYDSGSFSMDRLVEANTGIDGSGYKRINSYDELGRLHSVSTDFGAQVYRKILTYDDWGRLINERYQTGNDLTSAKDFAYRYNDKGMLARLERGGATIWRAQSRDAADRLVAAVIGNGLTQRFEYNALTGRLTGHELKTSSSEKRVKADYQYDNIGNVTTRTQAWDTEFFNENFTYDQLNRLRTSTLTNVSSANTDYSYDAAGNIVSKSDVGTYDYGSQGLLNGQQAARPHAVKAIGGNNFSYDDNGNLVNGLGRIIKWTSFDMPETVTTASASSSFVYGPELQRTKQIRLDKSYVYYADGQEIDITAAGAATVRTYWPMGVGFEIDSPGVATSYHWIHRDRLDSVIAITNQSGVLEQRLAYDPWGARRALNGGKSSLGYSVAWDNKGFNSHEMLDNLGLVHMNGRIYDPLTARFLSADPLVSDPENGQSYNRYSFVQNNPTNLTDSSGLAPDISDVHCAMNFSCSNQKFVLDALAAAKDFLSGGSPQSVSQVRIGVVQAKNIDATPPGGPVNNMQLDSNSNDAGSTSDKRNPCYGKPDCVWVPGTTVQQPGFAEGLIPVWGSGKQAIYDFQTGHYGWSAFNTSMAVSDVFLVKSLTTGVAKGAWKTGSHAWKATRQWYGKGRELPKFTQVHHWFIEQNSTIGKLVPEFIKNQPWNLHPLYATEEISSQALHTAVHGEGPNPFNVLGRWWYGTPDWAKNLQINLGGKAANEVRGEGN